MNLLAINGSPRRNRNTASLLEKIVEGAASAGAAADHAHLRDLGGFKGCISCFHCKDPKGSHYGRCIVKDNLTPVLDAAHVADILVLGTPVYFHAETGLMRNCMERLWFQYHLYSKKKGPLSPRKKATALVYTMNVPEEDIPMRGYDRMMDTAKGLMERFFGPCEVFLCADTRQFTDYSKYETDYFDAEAKMKRHAEVFPGELERAFALGRRLVLSV